MRSTVRPSRRPVKNHVVMMVTQLLAPDLASTSATVMDAVESLIAGTARLRTKGVITSAFLVQRATIPKRLVASVRDAERKTPWQEGAAGRFVNRKIVDIGLNCRLGPDVLSASNFSLTSPRSGPRNMIENSKDVLHFAQL